MIAAKQREQTPAETIALQAVVIEKAIGILLAEVKRVLGTVDPDEATWKDVGRLAKATDVARGVIDDYS